MRSLDHQIANGNGLCMFQIYIVKIVAKVRFWNSDELHVKKQKKISRRCKYLFKKIKILIIDSIGFNKYN
jgi:hypothetical protein